MALTSLPLLFLLLTVAGAAPPGCLPETCGDGTYGVNVFVTYPFWITGDGSNSSYCGYPDLDLECVDGVLSMKTLTDNYTVLGIDSSTRTIRLVASDILDSDCPRPRHNLTLDQILPLAYTSNDANLTFRFNCSSPAGPEANRVGCLGGLGSYVGWEDGVAECEEAVAVPVMRGSAEMWKWNMSLGFADVVKSGFELKWETSVMAVCRECEVSGGFCGYENRTDKGLVTVCYCDDGTHNLHCHDRGIVCSVVCPR